MGTAPRTGLAALVLAVSTGVWMAWTSVVAGTVVLLPLVVIAVIPTAATALAGWALFRQVSKWEQSALAYVAVYAAVVATGLPATLGALRHAGHPGIAWALAGITLLAAVTLASTVLTWRAEEGARSVPPAMLSRALATVGGLCLVASFFFPHVTTPAGSGLEAPNPLLAGDATTRISAALLLLLTAAVTAFAARGDNRMVWIGAVGGLAASDAIAVAALFDPTIQEAGAQLASGTHLGVAGVVVLVLALLVEVFRTDLSTVAEDANGRWHTISG